VKRIHVLRFEGDPGELEPLIAALRADDGRVGWLDLALADPVPPALARPASLDVLRAVAVGPQLAIAIKPMRGAPVLRDLLREHFRGCRVVLVAGEVEAPLLASAGDGWQVGERGYSTAQLVTALRGPRPFS
jgi:hypothetical protein